MLGETIEVGFEDIMKDNASGVHLEAPIISRFFVPARKNKGSIRMCVEMALERRAAKCLYQPRSLYYAPLPQFPLSCQSFGYPATEEFAVNSRFDPKSCPMTLCSLDILCIPGVSSYMRDYVSGPRGCLIAVLPILALLSPHSAVQSNVAAPVIQTVGIGNGTTLHYVDPGQGVPAIFVPG